MDSTLQSLKPYIIQIPEPPVRLVLDTDLITTLQLVNSSDLGWMFLPAAYWANATAGKKSRDDHTRHC
jgi:hypothetical protein